VKSQTRPTFWHAYESLDARIRKAARRAYRLFADNAQHPSLRFKKLGGYDDLWTVRISEQYRAVCERRGDVVIWLWIGTHNDFDKLFD
jgi:mRNA-degrading endonuclease RelE of RelBE toxin-antitoxin system